MLCWTPKQQCPHTKDLKGDSASLNLWYTCHAICRGNCNSILLQHNSQCHYIICILTVVGHLLVGRGVLLLHTNRHTPTHTQTHTLSQFWEKCMGSYAKFNSKTRAYLIVDSESYGIHGTPTCNTNHNSHVLITKKEKNTVCVFGLFSNTWHCSSSGTAGIIINSVIWWDVLHGLYLQLVQV